MNFPGNSLLGDSLLELRTGGGLGGQSSTVRDVDLVAEELRRMGVVEGSARWMQLYGSDRLRMLVAKWRS